MSILKRYGFVLLFIQMGTCLIGHGQEISSKNGVIDFQDWNLTENPVQQLKGEWQFYWNQLLDPKDIDSTASDFELRNCHQNWNNYETNGEKYSAIGYATYRLHLTHLPSTRLNLIVRNVLCACAVYIDDEILTEVGKVGTTKETTIPCWEDRIVPLPAGKTDFWLTVQIANFHHRKGGFNDPFYIGTEQAIYKMQRQQMTLNGFEMSSFLFAGCFFLTLFIFRRKDKTLLYFSLFCLTVAIRPFVSVNYMIYSLIPDINWYVLIHIEYLTLFLPSAFMLLFIRDRFPNQSPKKLLTWISYFFFIEAIASVVLPSTIFSWLVLPHQALAMVSFVIIFVVVLKAMRARVNGALFGGTAILFLVLSSFFTILQYLDLIEPMPFVYTGMQLGFILSMSLILGSKFSSEFRKVEYLQATTEEQRAELEVQHKLVEEKNIEITSSIAYAYRIQKAILPPDELLGKYKPESFILYKPKDIVAGDFYWVEKLDNYLFIAAADCTGHGVPGAMVSVVCNAALNRSIREFKLKDAGQILDKTRELVIESFHQNQGEVKDGMDIALCVLNLDSLEISFAGANNPLWIIRDKSMPGQLGDVYDKKIENEDRELLEFKGDKQPIGQHLNPTPFRSIKLQLSKGERIYLFSDGYPDQFGGEKGKKFMYKPFKELILKHSNESFSEQAKQLEAHFENWRGSYEQTDDVCIVGVKI